MCTLQHARYQNLVVVDTKKLTLKDGRDLAYCEFGDADGHPVFYAHGSPGSRLEGSMYHEKAAEYGIPDRLSFNISISGYSNFGKFPEAVALLSTIADRMSVGLSAKYPRLFASLFWLMRENDSGSRASRRATFAQL